MCGIAGVLVREDADVHAIAQSMADSMPWRGPDSQGVETLKAAAWKGAFGFRRLAIIDLSPEGNQPMEVSSAGLTIVFNGEIFNYRQLREKLTKKGHAFVTATDTEVILHSYIQWGRDCVLHLEGQFAFAIWDQRKQELFLARDRFGIKPLYLFQTSDRFLFSSEVRSLLASGLVPKALNLDAVPAYLYFGAVESPSTLVQGVTDLAPGSRAVWRNGSLKSEAYWRLEDSIGSWSSHPSSLDEVSHLLKESVTMELVSDVPLGAFLSGGIDSSAVVSCAVDAVQLQTVSLVFREEQVDERQHSSAVAKRFNTHHSEIEISAESVRDILPRFADLQDQPCVDGLNMYLVSRAARQAGLTVALSGLGGDEIFGGYLSFDLAMKWKRFGSALLRVPGPMRRQAARLLTTRSPKPARLLGEAQGPEDIYRVLREVLSPEQVASISGLAYSHKDHPVSDADVHPVDAMTLLEHSHYMRDTTLKQTDVMSMANSLEVRVPLLNYRLAECVMRVPPNQRIARRTPKKLLVDALPHPLPDSVVHRKKGTFTLPFDTWLRGDSRAFIEEMVFGARTKTRGLMEAGALNCLWNGFLDRRPGHNWARVWTVVCLEAWCRRYIDA